MIVVAGILLLVAMVWSGARSAPSGTAAGVRPNKVVLFGVPHVGLDDLTSGRMPVLSRLAAHGSVGAASIRTPSDEPSTVEAYATLGAGIPVVGPAAGADARMAGERIGSRTAAALGGRRPGSPATGQVVVLGGAAVVAATPNHLTSRAGALGTAIRRHGRRVAVLGNGDRFAGDGNRIINRPAAVALMNDVYWLNAGNVSGTIGTGGSALLRTDAAAPFGIRSNPDAIGAQTSGLLRRADVLVVDPGDMDRAAAADVASPADAERRRTEALARTDEALGRVVDALPARTLLLVVGVTPPTQAWHLTPLVAYGPGVPPGYLVSPSTHRPGLVVLTDLAPTVLAAIGVDQPAGMVGSPLRYRQGDASITALRETDDAASLLDRMQPAATQSLIVVQVVIYLALGLVLLRRRRPRRWLADIFRFAVVTFAAWPLATYVYRVLPHALQFGANGQVAVWAVAATLSLLAGLVDDHPLGPLQLVCGATVAVILADLATGARLQLSSIPGYSPQNAGRFTGLGNLGFAVLASTAITAGLIHVHRASPQHRTRAIVTCGVLFALVVVGDGWPTLGGDVGGTLTLLPILGACLYVLCGRALRWRIVLVAVVGALVVTIGMIGLDLLRPASQRTHLGRLAVDVFSDHGTLWTVLARKWSVASRPFRSNIWAWAVPVISLLGVYALVVRRVGERLLPSGSALRIAVTALLVVGLVGGLVNDSGVVITAMSLTYVGALLAVVALDRIDEPSDSAEWEPTDADRLLATGHGVAAE